MGTFPDPLGKRPSLRWASQGLPSMSDSLATFGAQFFRNCSSSQ